MYASVTIGQLVLPSLGAPLLELLLVELELLLPPFDELVLPLLLPPVLLLLLLPPLLLPPLLPLPLLEAPLSSPEGVTTLLPLLPQADAAASAASAGANQMSALRFPRRRLMLRSPDVSLAVGAAQSVTRGEAKWDEGRMTPRVPRVGW
jgi:hypothetical protein